MTEENEEGIEDEVDQVAQLEAEDWRRGMANVRNLFDQVDGLDASPAHPSGVDESQRSAFGLDQSDNNYATLKSRKSLRDRANTEMSQGGAFEKLIGQTRQLFHEINEDKEQAIDEARK